MEKLRLCTFLLVLLIGTVTSCSDDDNPDVPETAINKALALVSGTVTESEPETEEGVAAWKVDIRTEQGAEVEVYCRQDNGELLRIDGESPPFHYNIDPGNSLIDLNQAKGIAEAQIAEDLTYWRLRIEDKYDNIWVYTLEFTNSKIFIDAVDGGILDIEN